MHLRMVAWVWCTVILHLICVRGQGTLPEVKIGAVVSFNSSIGQMALISLALAVKDVNDNQEVLPNHQLVLTTGDSACNAFQGAAAAVELLKSGVVAVVGPQTSVVAQFAADLGGATQVPFVSFAATDPSLTEASNPYFLRTVHSDGAEMAAIAALVGLYGWREVAAITTNDYVGLNGLSALSDALETQDSDLVYKATIQPNINQSEMVNALNELLLLESRVYIVNLQPAMGRLLFSTAQSMSMMSRGFVWLITEAMASMLEDLPGNDPIWSSTQGVVGVRTYIPPSAELTAFQQKFLQQQQQSPITNSSEVILPSIYGMYAYDAAWMISRALDAFISSGKNFTRIPRTALPPNAGGGTELANLTVLAEGEAILHTIKSTSFLGITGPIQLDNRGDLVGGDYEIVNLIGRSARVVGYWNSSLGFSQLPSHPLNNSTTSSNVLASESFQPGGNVLPEKLPQQLQDVIWPGGFSQVPRGWAVAKNGQQLVIGVPLKLGFPQFVSIKTDESGVTTFHGFCIDVFQAAVSYLPYALNYSFVAYGNGSSTPNYDNLVQKIADKDFDAVVGDVTITTKRSKLVDFTQPYTASGLVVVVPTRSGGNDHAWAFMRPFTPLMWVTTGVFFLLTGLAIWVLEHKKNRDFRGKPKKQIVTVLWFIFTTLFFAQRENTKSTLGRAVLVIWLFVVLIVTSSYTASLTSILTVQQLLPTIQGIAGLVTSNVDIAFQAGSFVEDYLQQLNVPKERLVPLSNQTLYAAALRKGVVGAIVDELPYVQLFLSSECSFTIAGQEFTKSGWGFAFPKGSQLAVDMSTAILALAEDGHLQQLTDYWLNGQNCGASGIVQSNELGLSTFWGLFLITGLVSLICVIWYYARLIWQHHKTYRDDDTESEPSMSRSSRRKSFLRSLVSFIEEAEVAASVARNDAISNNQRKGRGQRRSSDFSMESGFSGRSDARSDEPITLPPTPDHTTNADKAVDEDQNANLKKPEP